MGYPRRRPNGAVRGREYLMPDAAELTIAAEAAPERRGNRIQALLQVTFRHALRVSQTVSLRRKQVYLKAGVLQASRLENGVPSTHPLSGPELRRLRQLRRKYPAGAHLCQSERGGPMSACNVRKLIARAGELAWLTFPVHPHMMRQACGFKLANDGHDTRALPFRTASGAKNC